MMITVQCTINVTAKPSF